MLPRAAADGPKFCSPLILFLAMMETSIVVRSQMTVSKIYPGRDLICREVLLSSHALNGSWLPPVKKNDTIVY